MLNTDIHNPSNKRKMTKIDFVRNNRGIDGDGDLPRELLEEVRTSVQCCEQEGVASHSWSSCKFTSGLHGDGWVALQTLLLLYREE